MRSTPRRGWRAWGWRTAACRAACRARRTRPIPSPPIAPRGRGWIIWRWATGTVAWRPMRVPGMPARPPPGGRPHGAVRGRLRGEPVAAKPPAADRAARARLDYLALGDWHGCLEVDARTWYAGTPEADRFRGNAPGHVLEVEIAAPGA